MQFTFKHNNLNVADLQKSIEFYQKALGLEIVRRSDNDNFSLVYMGDGVSEHKLELTWLKDHTHAYNLGENEIHLCFSTKDYEAAYDMHKEMGCICYENTDMGLYFISDPDGYWTEIVREK